ncbi:hypothetical protein VIBNISOn1_840010 [Vibrio nigripulchritudo SOn1]|uniref:Uncharacterized protein n=1 Tax=Vibrio nigripulchritudo SOn1 TaxID=1238450 RepID=A0AAV2VXV9_9VIBR|nr:hypothetical protein VIBNISFn118_1110002 [Vibrio nigripulchritudo SFn118]CCO49605.1 hypothetical protein VIBNISOn1_840010 [Vibrio nigripulchritudo SOn1]
MPALRKPHLFIPITPFLLCATEFGLRPKISNLYQRTLIVNNEKSHC